MTRSKLRTAIVGLVIGLVSLGAAAPASAATYAAGGSYGPSYIGRGACAYMRTNLNGWLQLEVAPPTIYARNNTTGWGNDAQRVRYRAFLVDARTGATVASTGYSGIAWAWDNSAPRFSGNTVMTGNWNGNYTIDYRIEWLDSSGRLLGWAAQRFNSFNYYNQRVGPYGPISSCLKYM